MTMKDLKPGDGPGIQRTRSDWAMGFRISEDSSGCWRTRTNRSGYWRRWDTGQGDDIPYKESPDTSRLFHYLKDLDSSIRDDVWFRIESSSNMYLWLPEILLRWHNRIHLKVLNRNTDYPGGGKRYLQNKESLLMKPVRLSFTWDEFSTKNPGYLSIMMNNIVLTQTRDLVCQVGTRKKATPVRSRPI